MNNLEHNQEDLGFNRPKNHAVESKKHIMELIRAEKNAPTKARLTSPWVPLIGIAASILFIFILSTTNVTTVLEESKVEEDVFVTSLLMDTLLLEEAELDQAIQEALLDDFENDLAFN